MISYDITQLSKRLSERVEDVCRWLLPNGRRMGNEWRIGDVEGNKGQSLGVNLEGNKGIWKDFSSDARGGDLIDLIMAVKGMRKSEAIKEAKEYLGISDIDPLTKASPKKYKKPSPPPSLSAPQREMLEWFSKRGISRNTLNKFRIGQSTSNDGKTSIVFPYFSKAGDSSRENLEFIKYRPLDSKKDMYTSQDSKPILFGWQVMDENSRTLVIVEGECDALACYEAGICAVSVPRGGGTDGKQDCWIDVEWDRLQQFDAIYLAMDMDKEGQSAAQYIAKRLGQHRCYFIDFGKYKDANEALMGGANIKEIFASTAHTIDPMELVPASDFNEDVWAFFENPEKRSGHPLPWESTNNKLGLRDGETTIWAGINGHGKSMIASHIVAHSVSLGYKWCIASMEFKPYKLLARLYRQTTGKLRPVFQDMASLNAFYEDKLWMFNVQGTARAERILEVFEYAYRRYGITNFLIDSLAKAGFADDDYSGQKAFVDKLSDFARNNEVQVHLVCHSRKKESEEIVPDKFDIKGSGGITDMVDNVYVVWRNKPKERRMQDGCRDASVIDEPDAMLMCCKQREGDWEGGIQLWFDNQSLQYFDKRGNVPVKYC